MKKKTILILIILVILSSCKMGKNNSLKDLVDSPEVNSIPIEGTWVLDKAESLTKEAVKNVLPKGIELFIDKELFAFEEKYTVNPDYSAKYVKYDQYIANKYVESPNINYEADNIQIVSVTDENGISQDVLIAGENSIYLSYNSNIYHFHKKNNQVDELVLEKFKEKAELDQNEKNTKSTSQDVSLLIGVKEEIKDENYDNRISYEYKTYLFRKEMNKPSRVYLINNLLVPRDEGFWMVDVKKKDDYTVFHSGPVNLEDDKKNILVDRVGRNITFLHNNFISFQKNNYYSLSNINNFKYEIRNIDDLKSPKTLSIKDIAGDEGVGVYDRYLNQRIDFYEKNFGIAEDFSYNRDTTNIGIVRNLANWEFITSVEISRADTIHYNKAKLPLVPLIDIFQKNENELPSNIIKSRTATASEAFSFSNNDYVVIKNDDEILICERRGNVVGNTLVSIQLNNNESIIMAEFGVDSYAKLWEEEFLKHDKEQASVLYYDQDDINYDKKQ